MPLPTITVDLAELLGEDGEPQTLADRIVEEAGRMLANEISNEVKAEIRKEVTIAVQQKAVAKIEEVFASQLYETDEWGTKRNEKPLTMAEMVLKETMKHLGERVSESGRSDYGDKCMTRLSWIAKRAAEECVKDQLQPHIKQAQDMIKAEIGNKLAAAFKAALKDAAGAFA